MGKYSTTSKLTKKVCHRLNYLFSEKFIKTRLYKGEVYISFTLRKPKEIKELYDAITNANKRLKYRVAPDFKKFLQYQGWV